MTQEEKERLIGALEIIRDVCDKMNKCEECSLSDDNGECLLSLDTPNNWVLNDSYNSKWTAIVQQR